MMIFTTLFVAAIVIAALYFVVVRPLRWPMVGYLVMMTSGVACFFIGSVHFAYIGIEIAALGSLLVWLHNQYWRKTIPKVQSVSDA